MSKYIYRKYCLENNNCYTYRITQQIDQGTLDIKCNMWRKSDKHLTWLSAAMAALNAIQQYD